MDTTTQAPVQAPLVPVTLAFLAGILVGTSARLPPWSPVIVGVMSAGVALWRWGRTRSGVVALLLLWGCLGALRMTVWERHPDTYLKAALSDDPQPVQLHGLVVDDPVELFEPGEAHTAEGDDATVDPDRQVCVVALRHRQTTQGWQPLDGRVRASVHSPRQLVRYGDEILVEGQWFRVPAPGNPGQYDWQAALARKRIHGLLRVRPFDGLVVLRQERGNPMLAAVFRLRERWVRLIQESFNPRDAGLLLGLLLGQRAEIDEDLKEAFQTTGTIHLLVISGFNVGLIAWLLELGLRLLGLPWRMRLALSAISLGGYCLLTGMQPPVVRATLMAWVILGAYALDRVISWPNTLAAAALLILWVNPTQLFDPSFQLSFGAVLSLMVFTPRWSHHLQVLAGSERVPFGAVRRGRTPQVVGWMRRYLAISLATTSAVWVGLVPVLAWYFHLVSPVSMIANLLITPLMSALIFLGTTWLVLATMLEPVAGWGGWMLALLVRATVACVSWCHRIPGGHWFVGPPPTLALFGYYGLIGVSMLSGRLRWSQGRVLLCWVAGLAVWVWGAAVSRAIESRWLRVDVLDVGHGDSILVRTPRGQTILVDGGTQEAGRFTVVPFLRSCGITTLDALVVTHPDADHLGGAIPVVKKLRVRRLLTNGARDDTMSARALRRLAAERRIPEVALAAGVTLEGDPDVRIDVLHPPSGLVPGTEPPSNDNSVVLLVSRGPVRVMLAGDIEEAGLPWLLGQGADLQAGVLKVPHHGSRLGAAGEAFFRAVSPSAAILSVGRAHHLPAPETLQALQRTGAELYATREHGAIQVRTDGERLDVRSFRGDRAWREVKRYKLFRRTPPGG